ncbi:MAG: hypothetical protein WAU76_10560, partial [Candidatus Sulfotelmatobacter sp.]
MLRLWSTALVVFLWLVPCLALDQASGPSQTDSSQTRNSPSASASDRNPGPDALPIPANAPRISKQSRYQIIREIETQLVYARTSFPMGSKGLLLKDGVITPNGEQLRQDLALWGPAVKPGDPAHISFVRIKDDHIHFEINGGPTRHKKWYQRVEVTGAYGAPVNGGPDDGQTNPHGTFVDLYFDKHVPEMTVAQLRALLYP